MSFNSDEIPNGTDVVRWSRSSIDSVRDVVHLHRTMLGSYSENAEPFSERAELMFHAISDSWLFISGILHITMTSMPN